MKVFTSRLGLIVLAMACATTVGAAVVAPHGLAPGSKYQLIFVTFSTTDAKSADPLVYDGFVAGEAQFGADNFGLPRGVGWHAVVSTPTIDARDNAPSGAYPVYNTAGQLVASSGIYAGTLLAPVYYDETGFSYGLSNVAVWTGSDPFGIGVPGKTLGDPGGFSELGSPQIANGLWLQASDALQLNQWALFALSDPITVPLPEPTGMSIALMGVAALSLGAFRATAPRR